MQEYLISGHEYILVNDAAKIMKITSKGVKYLCKKNYIGSLKLHGILMVEKDSIKPYVKLDKKRTEHEK